MNGKLSRGAIMSKGRRAEHAVADYLRTRGFAWAERRARGGTRDCGDIAGVPGWTIQVKNTANPALKVWMEQLARQRANAGSPYGVIVWRPPTVNDPGDWYAAMRFSDLVAIIQDLGGLPERD